MRPTPDSTALYRIYDGDGALLYVGITKTFGTRWEKHSLSQPWWPEVRRQTIDWYPTRESAEDAEADAIRSERPRHNITYNQEQTGEAALLRPPRAREADRLLSAKIRELRRRSGMSQAALATAMSERGWPWHQSTAYKIETGGRALDIIEACELAAVFGVPVADLVTPLAQSPARDAAA